MSETLDKATEDKAKPETEADAGADRDDEDELDDKMSLVEHLAELRTRLFYSVIALVVCFFACFYFASEIFNFLVAPLAHLWEGQEQRRLIYTALHEKFFTEIKVVFFAAGCLSFPIIASQIWLFIAPGLYKNEKRAFLPFLLATPFLFIAGAASVYYGVMPVAWKFFAGFEQAGGAEQLSIVLEPKVNEYLSLVMQLIFAFGIAFQLPVLLVLLVKVGIIDSAWLKARRRYAIVIAFVAAAVMTPPDPLSQIGLAVPIILLYEISIWLGVLVERKRETPLDA
ncbi:MAG TPA: twin-arginine translocase subunit TatC [Rhodospirillaceae bacterium]|nr:twin-arginine translocase subunit TatC [Rhodospirillaceae bacterium]